MTAANVPLLSGQIEARFENAILDPTYTVWDGVPFPSLAEALPTVMTRFRSAQAWTMYLWPVGDVHAGVTAIRVNNEEMILLDSGDGSARAALADLLPAYGYRELVLESATPLALLHSHLPGRAFNMLDRHGFATVEQVAAVPDLALMDVRNLGSKSITAIRDAIARVNTRPIAGPVTLSTDQANQLVNLVSVLGSFARGQGNVALAQRAETVLNDLFG